MTNTLAVCRSSKIILFTAVRSTLTVNLVEQLLINSEIYFFLHIHFNLLKSIKRNSSTSRINTDFYQKKYFFRGLQVSHVL